MNIFITGTSRGIGRYLMEYYAAQGHTIFGCSRSSFEYPNYTHFVADLTDEQACMQLCRKLRKIAQIDVLINNAGIASMNHFMMTSYAQLETIFKTNVFSSFLFMREFSKGMIKSGFGRIVNFSSVAVPLSIEGEAVYAASKSATETLTRITAKELGKFGNITVNAIAPNPIETDIIKHVPKDKLNALIAQQAIPRYGKMEDIANALDFFIDPNSSMITGQVVYLGGIS